MKIIHPVPYISQNWRRNVACDSYICDYSDEFVRYWSDRSCGLACASMAIAYFTGVQYTIPCLLTDAIEKMAYCDRGLIHSKLAELLCQYGVLASAVAANVDDIFSDLRSDHLFISSVKKHLPIGGEKGGHLILLRGCSVEKNKQYIFFNDPSRWGETRRYVSVKRFFGSYSGRGVTIARSQYVNST